MNVYRVEYKTAWQDDFAEENEKTVTAKTAELAIQKVRKMNEKEHWTDPENNKKIHRVYFELTGLTLVAELDG